VLDDHVGGQRRAGHQEARVLHGPAERLRVVLDAQVLDHRHQRPQFLRAVVLDQPEVQERHPALATEQVVARMRIPVEGVRLVQAPEHETVDGLRGQVAFGL
jgi:hypothetical protein